jgi:CheY-like chemotaxis protein
MGEITEMTMRNTIRTLVSIAKAPFESAPAPNYVDIFSYTRRLKVLLVEDDEPDAYLIGGVLANNPRVREVMIAEDGVQALELIDNGWFQPDLAFVDLHMPRKDGFSLLRELAAGASLPFPSVVLTSSKLGSDSWKAMDCGAVSFITKPKTMQKLAIALNQAIENAI